MVARDLEASGITSMLSAAIEGMRIRSDRSSPQWLSFGAIQAYLLAVSKYSEAEKALMNIVGLDKLVEPEIWQQLVHEVEPGIIYSLNNSIRFARDVLPKISTILEQEYVTEVETNSANLPDQLKGKELLTVLLPERPNEYSSPLRVSRAMEGISELYEVHSEIGGRLGNDLIILACDSGSDKSFDFLGVAAAINGVRETAIAIWDRAALQKQSQHSAGLDILIKSIPVIAEISNLAEAGDISREQEELLKRKVISGATKFLEAGATTKEMYDQVRPDPQIIMRPEPKLLAAPQSRPAKKDDQTDTNDALPESELTPQELAEMQRLLEKARRAKSTSSHRRNTRPKRK